MANVSATKNRLKSILTSLQKSVECPICLETIKIPFKACVRGHGVCLECTKPLKKCPLCQEAFTLENLVCLTSVLEVLPHLCRYNDDGCEEIVEPGNDHEMFCEYRPITCQEYQCPDKVPLNRLLEHYSQQHPKVYICKNESETVSWPNYPNLEARYNTPVFVFNNLFWIFEEVDLKEKQLKIWFEATPLGKLESDYYVKIKLEKGNFCYTYTLKAILWSSCETKYEGERENEDETKLLGEEYCMKIPLSELSRFINDKGEIEMSYLFFKE